MIIFFTLLVDIKQRSTFTHDDLSSNPIEVIAFYKGIVTYITANTFARKTP